MQSERRGREGSAGGEPGVENDVAAGPHGAGQGSHLHIFVNRRKFTESDGVTPQMTGGQIAALVGVPAENAVIVREGRPGGGDIAASETVTLHNGEHFLVTRKHVDGGATGLVDGVSNSRGGDRAVA